MNHIEREWITGTDHLGATITSQEL